MPLTAALNTSLNGMSLNEVAVDVISNNIANANTAGFKSANVKFATQLSRTLSVGSRPSETSGGTNPRQIAFGASLASVRPVFQQGAIQTSSTRSDLAIQGDGFFIVENNAGPHFTRNGQFSLNSDNTLVTPVGDRLKGYGVNSLFETVDTEITDVRIPLGRLTTAQPTTRIDVGGTILSTGPIGTHGAQLLSEVMFDATTSNPVTSATLLVDVRDLPANPLFAIDDVVRFTPQKAGSTIGTAEFVVGSGTTVGDLLEFFDQTFGIHSDAGVPVDGNTGTLPGVGLTSAGEIHIVGNMGVANDLDYTVGDFRVGSSPVGLGFTKLASAAGEGAVAQLTAFDSLGQEFDVRVRSVIESQTTNKTVVRLFTESFDDSDTDIALTTSLIEFDSEGTPIEGVTNVPRQIVTVDREDSAAFDQEVLIDFSRMSGISTAGTGSAMRMEFQNGSPPGTLADYVIDESGIISGFFDNGLIRTLGQVLLARFPNPAGLVEKGATLFAEGVGSGTPRLVRPGVFGAGTLRSGAIELSTTDIGKNLVDLIANSTNYRGNARVFGTARELIDELLVLGR